VADDAGASAGRTRWPTLRQQLREAGVRPGTRLDELIRNNQDFSLLRPEELNDRLRIPPWLRVYFLKRHPEITPIPGDPTGGYPLALRDLYNWMVENQDLPEQASEGDDDGH
jgi:hypothetical protein